jgi:hypothetical protein
MAVNMQNPPASGQGKTFSGAVPLCVAGFWVVYPAGRCVAWQVKISEVNDGWDTPWAWALLAKPWGRCMLKA